MICIFVKYLCFVAVISTFFLQSMLSLPVQQIADSLVQSDSSQCLERRSELIMAPAVNIWLGSSLRPHLQVGERDLFASFQSENVTPTGTVSDLNLWWHFPAAGPSGLRCWQASPCLHTSLLFLLLLFFFSFQSDLNSGARRTTQLAHRTSPPSSLS